MYQIIDFEIIEKGQFREELDKLKITSFSFLCDFISKLPYGRNSNREDFSLVLSERKGTCSSKHGLISTICEINQVQEIELVVGIFLMNEQYSIKVHKILKENNLSAIPEAHSHLRYQGKRFDFTSQNSNSLLFEKFLIREQRCEANQLIEWKPTIHKHYMTSWMKRKNIPFSLKELWDIREKCIEALSD
jgi:hypothetical protein